MLALGVEGLADKGQGWDARDLQRILEGEEQALGRPLRRVEGEQVLAVKQGRAARDLIPAATGEGVAER